MHRVRAPVNLQFRGLSIVECGGWPAFRAVLSSGYGGKQELAALKSEARNPTRCDGATARRESEGRPKSEILTWRGQNQRGKRATAEYAEYSEKDCLSSWVSAYSAYSAYSAVQDRSHLGFNYTRTKRRRLLGWAAPALLLRAWQNYTTCKLGELGLFFESLALFRGRNPSVPFAAMSPAQEAGVTQLVVPRVSSA